jgi:hypothetical protein
MIDALVKQGAQFIIATHSPILLAYPNAKILSFDATGILEVAYEPLLAPPRAIAGRRISLLCAAACPLVVSSYPKGANHEDGHETGAGRRDAAGAAAL